MLSVISAEDTSPDDIDEGFSKGVCRSDDEGTTLMREPGYGSTMDTIPEDADFRSYKITKNARAVIGDSLCMIDCADGSNTTHRSRALRRRVEMDIAIAYDHAAIDISRQAVVTNRMLVESISYVAMWRGPIVAEELYYIADRLETTSGKRIPSGVLSRYGQS